jgi:hypothetical protein
MIENYNPQEAPDPKEWLEMEEVEQQMAVMESHPSFEDDLSKDQFHIHCMMHAVVETQIAMGDEIPVQAALQRLMRQGLDRHSAVHAIASVLTKHLWEVGTGRNTSGDINEAYMKEVKQLTPQKWIDEFGEEE